MTTSKLLDHTVFIGGPPRGGTTFAAKSLNLHPSLAAAIDDHVYECWGLYFYRDRTGLIRDIRDNAVSPAEINQRLGERLVTGGQLRNVAISPKTTPFSPAAPVAAPAPGQLQPRSALDNQLQRVDIPLQLFPDHWRLCLKSPEITHALPQLAEAFPQSRFLLVFRPAAEIAESMFRMGEKVKRFPVFHRRWREERDENGELAPPPGVPAEWTNLWRESNDFQRCVIYAASYLRALDMGTSVLAPHRFMLYDHTRLRRDPAPIHQRLSAFLDIDPAGFAEARRHLDSARPTLPPDLAGHYRRIAETLDMETIMKRLTARTEPS